MMHKNTAKSFFIGTESLSNKLLLSIDREEEQQHNCIKIFNLYHSVGLFSRRQIDYIFSYFSQKTAFDISYKLSLLLTICMKCQNLFSGENKKNTSMCRLLKILPRVPSVNLHQALFFSEK